MSLEHPAKGGTSRLATLSRYRTVLKDYLLSGFLWSVLASLLNQGSTLLSSLVLARIVGLVDFGRYAIVLGIVMTFAAIAQGGAGLVAAKFVAEYRGSENRRIGGIIRLCRLLTLSTGLCGAGLMLISAPFLANSVYGSAELVEPLRIGAAAVFFQTGVAYLQGSLQGFGAFRALSNVGLLAGVGQIFFVCVGALLGGLTGATIGLALSSAARFAVFYTALAKTVRTHGVATNEPLTPDDWKLIWRFALPAGLSGFITVPAQSIVMAILARLPEGAALVGIYAAVNQIRMISLQMPTLLNSVTVSVLNNLKGRAQLGQLRNLYATNVFATVVMTLLVVLPVALLLPQVLQAYGEGFVLQGWFAYVLLLSALPEVLSSAIYQLVQAAGRMWHSLLWIVIPRDLSFVLLSCLGISIRPLEAVAMAYLTAQLISVVATWVIARNSVLEAP